MTPLIVAIIMSVMVYVWVVSKVQTFDAEGRLFKPIADHITATILVVFLWSAGWFVGVIVETLI